MRKTKVQQRLHDRIRRLIEKWSAILGVHVNGWQIKEHADFKEYWASIDMDHSTIAFCSRLAGKPSDFVEFVVVHELVHLLTRGTRGHGQRFHDIMDLYLPSWRKHAGMEHR